MDYRRIALLALVVLLAAANAAAAPTGGAGAYRLANGDILGVYGLNGPQVAVDFTTGEAHGLFSGVAGYDVGAGILERGKPVGGASFGDPPQWLGTTAERVPVRFVDVCFGVLAGTLWLPRTPGRHAAVAIVHGSGPTTRDYTGPLPAYFASRGLVVLAYDK